MTEHDTKLTLNGDEHEFSIEPRTLLVRALRDELGHTRINVGCRTSMCGAYRTPKDGDAVKSSTVLAVRANGSEITIVEGLTEAGEFHPNQASFKEGYGLQRRCCVPGMMIIATACLEGKAEPECEDICHALKGGLCQCTGDQNIASAVKVTAGKAGDARRAG